MRRMISPEELKTINGVKILENGNVSINDGAVIVKPDGTIEIGKDAVVDGNVKVNGVENLTDMDGTPLEFGGGGKIYLHKIAMLDTSYNEFSVNLISSSSTSISPEELPAILVSRKEPIIFNFNLQKYVHLMPISSSGLTITCYEFYNSDPDTREVHITLNTQFTTDTVVEI